MDAKPVRAPLWSLVEGNLEVAERGRISEDDIWTENGPHVWRADVFDGCPSFYPVYRDGSHYSFSPLPLIVRKGSLKINHDFLRQFEDKHNYFYSGPETIDREIVRIGGPIKFSPDLDTREAASQCFVEALRADVARVESRHPDHVNVILCGGKDSLNLLLLPWRNPVLVVSGAPNFPLVQEFIRSNGLPWDVEELIDVKDESVLRAESLANAGLMALEHARWGAHLVAIGERFQGRAAFWLGQMADAFTTPYWRTYFDFPSRMEALSRKVLNAVGLGAMAHQTPDGFAGVLWSRGAMWQGAHLQMLRMLTGCLVLSAYHGPAMRQVVPRLDLRRAVRDDIRPLIGEKLAGAPVLYPSSNPGPPASLFRHGWGAPHRFLEEAAAALKVEIVR
jgi:hypothetical protein